MLPLTFLEYSLMFKFYFIDKTLTGIVQQHFMSINKRLYTYASQPACQSNTEDSRKPSGNVQSLQ